MERVAIGALKGAEATAAIIAGFVHARRDHGKLIFIDLRDETGKMQVVFNPKVSEYAHQKAEHLRSEWVCKVTGEVKERPHSMQNPDEPNGSLEFVATDLEILSEAATPPFEISGDTAHVGEDVRLAYRYLDLRTERMQKNIRTRSRFVRGVRDYLFTKGFTEIETPLLTKSTPEGSRDFVVPSRLHQGQFYALPQSPQQYKQLLMAAGFEKYFQIARCLRDEDLRADRGFEHTQLDLEMAFVTEYDVLDTVESMIAHVVEEMGYHIKQRPFPRYTYAEAMKEFGADKFDLRTHEEKEAGVLAYAWVTDFPFFEKTEAGTWTFTHNPFSMPKEEHCEQLLKGSGVESIIAQQYDLVCNGFECGGGSIRAHRPDILRATYRIMGYDDAAIERSIGHMLEAFSYGTPPHGGIALGIERNTMNLTGEIFLREVQAFPQTSSGKTAVMDAPSELLPEQLAELGIAVDPTEQ